LTSKFVVEICFRDFSWGRWEAFAMKDQYVAAIVIAALAAGTGGAVYSLGSQSNVCPQPWSASVNALFAPCQAVYGAISPAPWGNFASKPDAMRMVVLALDEQSAPEVAPRLQAVLLADRLAGSVDPFLHPSGS
jgi:hypothetical protein